ncbi:hypothetical protein C0J52_13394 [Blattella germanica]|nr:hypothetical protein C0J52_13394 [Blattella germanica]
MGGKWIDELEVLENIPGCEPFCLPHCQNNGTCVSPNVCKCSKGFFGPQCQFETKPCLNFPQLPKNSRRICGSKSCTILCATGFVFPGGSSVANMVCRDGNWVPTRSDWNSIPDCQPICQPSCQNNSICVSPNVCNCLEGFAGPQCLYQGKPCMNPPPAPVNSRRICRPKYVSCFLKREYFHVELNFYALFINRYKNKENNFRNIKCSDN